MKPKKIKRRQVCIYCRGTGLEYEEARLLRERKLPLTQNEINRIICRKINANAYSTDYINEIHIGINQNDLIHVIKSRGLFVPCVSCAGKGEVHTSVIQNG